MNVETSGSYVKYTNESGKVFSTINTNTTQIPLTINFNKFQYVKDGIIKADMFGTLAIDTDTTTIRITAGKLNLKADN
jgi:thiamine biosynthesis lipoprotein ApbE